MFRRRVLSSVLTLGMFVGACDMTALYPDVSQSFGFNAFEIGKISVRLVVAETEDPNDGPPNGVKDPPGKVQ